jgi:hypothetical protein
MSKRNMRGKIYFNLTNMFLLRSWLGSAASADSGALSIEGVRLAEAMNQAHPQPIGGIDRTAPADGRLESPLAMIDVRDVSKSFSARGSTPVHALKSASVAIRDNQFFTLLGPSGCGDAVALDWPAPAERELSS